MSLQAKKSPGTPKKDLINSEIRRKMGMTQAQLAALLSVSRSYVTLAETGRRNVESGSNAMLANLFLEFHQLETGQQAADRLLETKLFLNDEYKKILPKMEAQEQDIRFRIKLKRNCGHEGAG